MPTAPRTPWVPFVTAALLFTVLVGALNGAINLWSLHVLHRGVAVEHHQSHAIAQLFGFMWLLTAGVSFHLAPRLFGAALPSPKLVRLAAIPGIAGVTLFILGRLGSLLPGSRWLGVLGAIALVAAMAPWVRFVWSRFRARTVVGDWLPMFVMAGAFWWLFATVTLFVWQLGQSVGGPFARVPFELVTASALFGGTASWVLGITLRAGACTMRIERSSAKRQRIAFIAWQLAATLLVVQGAFVFESWTRAVPLAAGLGLIVVIAMVRPFQRAHEATMPNEPLLRVAMVVAWAFAAVAAVLFLWQGAAVFGVTQPALLKDAARHAFTLGFTQLAVFGFAGRMLPGFEGVSMPSRRLYDAGVLALIAGAALRVLSILSPWKPAMVASGVSGGLALIGVGLVSWCFFRTMREGSRMRRAHRMGLSSLHLRAPMGA